MTKEIELTQGKVTLVDDDMYEELNQHKWNASKCNNTWYAFRHSTSVNGIRHTIRMHRQILGLEFKDGKIADHINRDGLDNRRDNLRVVNWSLNNRNHGGYANNTSGYTGVHLQKPDNKWIVQLRLNGKSIYLGYYDNIEDAIEARKQGELKYLGYTA